MSEEIIVTVEDESTTFVTTNDGAPTYVETMDNIGDVDTFTNGKVNGSVLVYKTATGKWTSTTTLDAQNMEGGEF
jgi:hypothetical protein